MKVTVQLRVNSATYHPNMAGERDLCTMTPIWLVAKLRTAKDAIMLVLNLRDEEGR